MLSLSGEQAYLIIAHFILFGLSAGVLHRHWHSPFLATLTCAFVFIGMLLSGLYVFSNYFTGHGIDESVIFHLFAGVDGIPAEIFYYIVVGVVLYLIFVLAVSLGVLRVLWSVSAKSFTVRAVVPLFCILLSFSVHPATSDIYWLFQPSFEKNLKSDIGSEEQPIGYVGGWSESFPQSESKPNIIYIYAESLERTFLNEKEFPGLTPNLNDLKSKALDFTNIRQAYATGWTIAGMVASQCGAPLITPVGINRTDGLSGFLPGLTCLGDILKSQGYFLSYMGGADLSFANKGAFYEEHGFDEVVGRRRLSELLDDESYVSQWGIYDDFLYEQLLKKIRLLSRLDRPYALVALTLDTHAPEGFPSKSCSKFRYQDGSNPMLNAVHCADHMVGAFISRLEADGILEDTILVIGSDHLAMHNSASSKLELLERRNLLMILSPDGKAMEVNRPGSTLDIAPTLLGLQGSNIQALGFGRNLLGNDASPPRPDDLDAVISSHKAFFMRQWSFDQLEDGIIVIPDQNILKFGENKIGGLPVLISFDKEDFVDRIYFQGMNSPDLVEEANLMPSDGAYSMIGRCSKVSLIPAKTQSKWCLVQKTRLGDRNVSMIDGYKYYSREELVPQLSW